MFTFMSWVTALATVNLLPSAFASLQDCLNDVCADQSDCVKFADDGLDILNTFQLNWVKPYNLAVNVNPDVVIRPNSTKQVAATVQCAAQNGYKVQAKSGGHSYANFGLGDGAVAIDLVNINQYSIDNATGYATIGAGLKLGDIDNNLHETGRAFAHGVCPSVGIGGHATIVSYFFPLMRQSDELLMNENRRAASDRCPECGGRPLITLSSWR